MPVLWFHVALGKIFLGCALLAFECLRGLLGRDRPAALAAAVVRPHVWPWALAAVLADHAGDADLVAVGGLHLERHDLGLEGAAPLRLAGTQRRCTRPS